MTVSEVKQVLGKVRGSEERLIHGKVERVENGSRIHLHYKKIPGAPVTAQAVADAKRADELGLPKDRYTGRVSRVWASKAGDTMLTMLVELERDHQYRCFNIDKGEVVNFVIMGV